MNVMHLWVLWFALKCRVVKQPQGLEVMILQTKGGREALCWWFSPVQGFPSILWWKYFQRGPLIFSEPTAFLSVPSSCPWADRKVHDSHGYWTQNVGMDLFSWNKEIFAIYSCSQTQTILFPQKQRASILKKDQWTVIVLSFLRRVSFPVLHQLWPLFPWWKGQHLCICTVSENGCLLLYVICFPLDDSLSFHVHCMDMERQWAHADGRYCSLSRSFFFSIKPGATPCFWELRAERLTAQKTALIC